MFNQNMDHLLTHIKVLKFINNNNFYKNDFVYNKNIDVIFINK